MFVLKLRFACRSLLSTSFSFPTWVIKPSAPMCGALSGKSSLKSRERGWKHKVAAQFLKHNLAAAAKLCFNSHAIPVAYLKNPIAGQTRPYNAPFRQVVVKCSLLLASPAFGLKRKVCNQRDFLILPDHAAIAAAAAGRLLRAAQIFSFSCDLT